MSFLHLFRRSGRLLFVVVVLTLLTAIWPAGSLPIKAQGEPMPSEQPVTLLKASGALKDRHGQFSGMAWYGDTLIIVPQYPAVFDNQFLAVPKQAIIDAIHGVNAHRLAASFVPLFGYEPLVNIEGFQGFESIAFVGERVYLTIETEPGDKMVGYLTTGMILPDLSGLRLYPTMRSEIPAQTSLLNLADESLIVAGNRVITFYEANGLLINPRAVAHLFDAADLQPLGTIPMAHLDYRLTDATPPDAENHFWVINTFYPYDLLNLGPDPLAIQYGRGPTHRQYKAVERLVQMALTPDGVELVPQAPIQLQLSEPNGRNWEGIVRLKSDDLSGFLLITDKKPGTLFGFVADPR